MSTPELAKDDLIRHFDLQPHPEGGFFRETYRSMATVRREGSGETRSASTAIYYLLCDGAHSAWHRIKSDEVWHFYAGEPLLVHVLDEAGQLITYRLGNPLTHPGSRRHSRWWVVRWRQGLNSANLSWQRSVRCGALIRCTRNSLRG
jgi:predicted cupin superfamily sugar epimerase